MVLRPTGVLLVSEWLLRLPTASFSAALLLAPSCQRCVQNRIPIASIVLAEFSNPLAFVHFYV